MSKRLYDFINRAGKATYAGGGERKKVPERKGFIELEHEEGNLHYLDSYTGYFRSRGTEVVREGGIPIWSSMYGGGMVEGREELAGQTFDFLKKAMSADEEGFNSFRGPHNFSDGDWEYTYEQEGDIEEFYGYEEIQYKGEKVFWHRIIGGTIQHKNEK
jgi:hypothetical protein